MPYPQPPTNKQYGSAFPDIPTRSVPEAGGVKSVEDAPLALHVEGSKTAESLGPPKRIDLGVLRLWLTGGPRSSRSFDDGPSFDYGKHDIVKAKDEGDDDFNLAPGTDEGEVKIAWQVYGLPAIKSAKLELYGRDMAAPIWEHHWGNAWGKKKAEIADFASKSRATGPTHAGELAFTEVKADTAAKGKDAAGAEYTAFPKGLLTVAQSPYQLRLTVSGCTAACVPADGDQYVYPMTAWTYLHVLVHGFDYKFGDPKWIETPRTDIDDANKDAVSGKGGAKGLEVKIIDDLRAFVTSGDKEAMGEGTDHQVALTSNHIKSWGPDEFGFYQKMWGLGARIPIVATAKIRTLARTGTDKSAADVIAGASLLWDWGEPDPKRLKTIATATPTLGNGKLTEEFLAKVTKKASETFFPRGSFNCPKELGGKYGDDTAPIFRPQPSKGNGTGSPPYVAKPCSKRSWAVVSTFDDKGETGVIFQPSRFPGDAYKIRTYLYLPELDKTEAIKDGTTAVGSPGTFTVYRRVLVHHLVVGDMPGAAVTALRDAVRMAARKQTFLHLELSEGLYAGGTYAPFMAEVAKNLILTSGFASKYLFHGLELPFFLKTTGSPGAALFATEDQTTLKRSVDQLFRTGSIRVVKKIDFQTDRLGSSDSVKGTGGKIGCLLDLGHKVGADDVCYAIAATGHPAFTDGESTTGTLSAKVRSLTYAQTLKSCWNVAVTKNNTKIHGKTVRVRFTGVDVDLAFKRGAFDKDVASELSAAMKTAIKDGYERAAAAFNDGNVFNVIVEGHEGKSSSSQRRIANVVAEVNRLTPTTIIQREAVLKAFVDEAQSKGDSSFYALGPSGFGTAIGNPANMFAYVRDAMAFTHAKAKSLAEGLVIVHASRFSNLTDFTDQPYLKDTVKNIAFTDYPCGGAVNKSTDGSAPKVGLADPAYEKLGIIYAITPDPAGAHYFKVSGRTPKKSWSIFLHELGHGLYLEHAKATRSGQLPAGSPRMDEHVKDEPCIMSYDSDTDQFCALCMVRLRGWRWTDIAETSPYFRAKIHVELGDVDGMFGDAATSDEGKKARLQVLGLLNKPLSLEGGPFDAEFKECWAYVWKLAKKLLPGVDAEPARVLTAALREFLVEGGKLPADNEQARLRVWAHFHPYYSNMDMAMRYGDVTVAGKEENKFKMGAVRGDIEAMFVGANPTFGSYPIQITVTDEAGAPMPDTDVWVTLVAPEPLKAYNDVGPGTKLLGATTFVQGTASAPLEGTTNLAHVAKWFDANVKGHDKSPDSDPQKGNGHFEMGGKRRMIADGDVGTPVGGIRNVFSPFGSSSSGPALPAPVDGGGSKVPHAILVETDRDGKAQFLFTPSTVAGDAYRLQLTVPHPTEPTDILGKTTTGNLVVWRTHRVGGYYQMPNATTDADMPAYWRSEFRTRTLMQPEAEVYKPLAPLNLKKSVGTELARSFCEVLFDDEALTVQPIDGEFWRIFNKNADAYATQYSTELIQIFFTQILSKVLLAPVGGSARTFRGRIQQPKRGHIAVGTQRTDDLRFDHKNAFAHDYDKALPDGATPPTGKLISLKAGDSIFGFETVRAPESTLMGKLKDGFEAIGGAIEVDDTQSLVNYTTGDVTVVLKADLPAQPFNWNNPNNAWWGPLISVTGATLQNTSEGRLFGQMRQEKAGWAIFFYKAFARQPADLVASVRKQKAGAKKVKARPDNHSGLTIVFDLGDTPKDGAVHQFYAGVAALFCGYIPEQVVDPKALIDPAVTRSPCLLNHYAATEYNGHKGAGYPDAPVPLDARKTPFELLAGEKLDYGWAETILMRALAATPKDQGLCYYPGQFYIQANYIDVIQGGGLGGKGVGNTAFIFNQGKTDATQIHYLLLHETGHCLYGIHAPTEPGNSKWLHDTDVSKECIMGKPADSIQEKQLGHFCGKCNAGLRGYLVMEKPLWPDAQQTEKGAPKPGTAAIARKPLLGSPSGGLTIPDTVVHVDDPAPPDPTDDEILAVLPLPPLPPDEREVECLIAGIAQEKSNWCWAAVSQMARKYFAKEVITQCKLATEALGFPDKTDCCKPENDAKCNIQHALALTELNVTQSGEGTVLDWDVITKEIEEDRPFIVASGHHYHMCYGYSTTGGGQDLLIWNPLPVGVGAKERMSYGQYTILIGTEVTLDGGRRGHGANYYGMSKK